MTYTLHRRVTLSDATKNMFAYSQLNDSILNTLKLLVDDSEVTYNKLHVLSLLTLHRHWHC